MSFTEVVPSKKSNLKKILAIEGIAFAGIAASLVLLVNTGCI